MLLTCSSDSPGHFSLGTTWSGTLEKMAMPGVLFHHETPTKVKKIIFILYCITLQRFLTSQFPTKDYIHDRMKAWVHYVPIQEDLSDLYEKYQWAEVKK